MISTWCEVVNDASGDGRVFCRSAIQVVLAKISHMLHFGLVVSLGHMAMNLVENGVVGQDPGQYECCKACQ